MEITARFFRFFPDVIENANEQLRLFVKALTRLTPDSPRLFLTLHRSSLENAVRREMSAFRLKLLEELRIWAYNETQ
jgi:hypothetical protein